MRGPEEGPVARLGLAAEFAGVVEVAVFAEVVGVVVEGGERDVVGAAVHLLQLVEQAGHGGAEVLLEAALAAPAQGKLGAGVEGLEVLGAEHLHMAQDVGLLAGEGFAVLAEQTQVVHEGVAGIEGVGVAFAEHPLAVGEGLGIRLVRLAEAAELPQGDAEVVPGDEGGELAFAEEAFGVGEHLALERLRLLVLAEETQVAADGVVREQRAESVGGLCGGEAVALGEIEVVRLAEAPEGAQDVALLGGQVQHGLVQRVHEGGPVAPDLLGELDAGLELAAAEAVAQAVEHGGLDARVVAEERSGGLQMGQEFRVTGPVPAVHGIAGVGLGEQGADGLAVGFAVVALGEPGDDVVDEPVHVHGLLVRPHLGVVDGPPGLAGEHRVVDQGVQGAGPGGEVGDHPAQVLGEVRLRIGADETERDTAGGEGGAQAEHVDGLRLGAPEPVDQYRPGGQGRLREAVAGRLDGGDPSFADHVQVLGDVHPGLTEPGRGLDQRQGYVPELGGDLVGLGRRDVWGAPHQVGGGLGAVEAGDLQDVGVVAPAAVAGGHEDVAGTLRQDDAGAVGVVPAVEDDEPAGVRGAPAQGLADGADAFAGFVAGGEAEFGGEFAEAVALDVAVVGADPPHHVVVGAEAVGVLGGDLGLADAGHAEQGARGVAAFGVHEPFLELAEEVVAAGEAWVAARDLAPDLGRGVREADEGPGGQPAAGGAAGFDAEPAEEPGLGLLLADAPQVDGFEDGGGREQGPVGEVDRSEPVGVGGDEAAQRVVPFAGRARAELEEPVVQDEQHLAPGEQQVAERVLQGNIAGRVPALLARAHPVRVEPLVDPGRPRAVIAGEDHEDVFRRSSGAVVRRTARPLFRHLSCLPSRFRATQCHVPWAQCYPATRGVVPRLT
ncbi:hypothetical protein STANM309S_02377 [Streptomyces tanashiensis]